MEKLNKIKLRTEEIYQKYLKSKSNLKKGKPKFSDKIEELKMMILV